MNRNWFSLPLIFAAALFVPGCGSGQQLVEITVTPSGFVFEGVGAQGQFTALGTYIHPPATKDISNRVTWKIDVANLATITQTGLVTALSVCGSGDVTATSYSDPANPSASNILVGTATVEGVENGTPQCMP
jgi:hypothetical protein